MKSGRRQAPNDNYLYKSNSKHSTHCCKCYHISAIFSTDTKRTTLLSKHSLDSVKTQFLRETASSSGCESASELTNSPSTKKTIKWTIDLHENLLDCVNQLGGPMKAKPNGILKLLRSHALTIHHVKSHLQKYRLLKQVQDSTQEKRLEEEEIHTKDPRIEELMRLQNEVGKHLQEQLEMQRELYLLVEEQNQRLQEMIKYQKGKIL